MLEKKRDNQKNIGITEVQYKNVRTDKMNILLSKSLCLHPKQVIQIPDNPPEYLLFQPDASN